MKHVIIYLFLSSVIFGVSVFAQKAKPKVSELPANIAEWVGEDSDKILENEIIKARLKKLLGEKDYTTFTEYFETSKPIEKDGNFLFSSGCMIHSCTHLESAIAIDTVNNIIHAAIYNEIEKTKYFNGNNSNTPKSIINWANRLEKLKTPENQKEAVLVDEFLYQNSEDFMARFDNFTVQLQNQPNASGYIVINGNKNSRTGVEKEIKEYVKVRGLDVKKLVFLNGDGDSKILIRLWVVPEGVEPPDTINNNVQKNAGSSMKKEALESLVKELKEVVSKNSPNKNEAKLVADRWDKRRDLAGKTKSEVIELLYEDVKAVIKDSGIQYQIYSIFSFYKQIPDESASAQTQKIFELKDASKYFDIKIKVANCEDGFCGGKASFSFYKKGGTTAYQVINLPDTQIQLDENGNAQANVSMLYDNQSAVNVGDFNFDGMEDVAICDGAYGSYGGPSYQVYLSSKSAGKFVYNKAFSELGQKLGMFDVDTKKKVLRTFDKSGCCWHITEEYSVANGRPVKTFVEEEDATIANQDKVKITTKTLVNGKWKTKVKYVKREE